MRQTLESNESTVDVGHVHRWTGWTRITGVIVFCCALLTGSAFSASAATTSTGVSAVWEYNDGCVWSFISVSSQTTAGIPRTHIYYVQEQTCDDPNSVTPVLSFEGSTTGGTLQTSNTSSAHLIATIPLTCTAYTAGACAQAPYNSETLSLDLSWNTPGKLLRYRQDGTNCFYRYGTATGSILIGGVNLLATDQSTWIADPTETNVRRCVG